MLPSKDTQRSKSYLSVTFRTLKKYFKVPLSFIIHGISSARELLACENNLKLKPENWEVFVKVALGFKGCRSTLKE